MSVAVASPEAVRPYDTSLLAIQYYRNVGALGLQKVAPEYADPYVSELEDHAMTVALDLAQEAMMSGNPPVGSVLITGNGQLFGARTADWSASKINAHGEIVAYENAQPVVGRDLSECTLVSTAVLCASCSPVYAEGEIGRVVTSAPRWLVWQLIGMMRPRDWNMHDAFADGNTNTLSVIHHRLDESLGLFAMYGQLKGYRHPEPIDETLVPHLLEAERAI